MADDATTIDAPETTTDAPIGTVVVEIGGLPYMRNASGGYDPVETIKAKHLLEDELVRTVVGYAVPLAAQVARFRQHTFDDVDQLVAVLEQEHGAPRGGTKGNLSFTSYDGLFRVQVSVAENVVYGAELQVAKGLVDECLRDWAGEVRAEIRAILTNAFNVDQAGKVNRGALLSLRRFDFNDERWSRAMIAITEAERPISSKRYVNVYHRAKLTDGWTRVTIDMASA